MLRTSMLTRGTLVKIGRGANNVTESASNALLESLQDHGYCYIQHPFIQKTILDQLHRDCRIFFEQYILSLRDDAAQGNLKRNNRHNYNCTPLSPYELESIKSPSGFRGYHRYVGASGIDDAIDCFSVGRDDVADPAVLRRDYYKQAGWEESEYLSMISRRNPWDVLLNHVNSTPAAGVSLRPGTGRNDNFMSDFKDMMMAYYDLCYTVSMDVLRHISCGLGIRPSIPQGGPDPAMDFELEYFTSFHQKRDCDLQAKYYPQLGEGTRLRGGVGIENQRSAYNPGGVKVLRRKGAKMQPLVRGAGSEGDGDDSEKDITVRLDTHKDLSTITLLSQDALGGLEVWDEEKGSYTAVPVLEDALLVNAGMFLEKWTGGLIDATPHRVRNVKGNNSRCSIVFFALPDHDARIEPLLQQEDNPAVDAQDSFLAGDMMPTP